MIKTGEIFHKEKLSFIEEKQRAYRVKPNDSFVEDQIKHERRQKELEHMSVGREMDELCSISQPVQIEWHLDELRR